MTSQGNLRTETKEAAGDLSAAQYRMVKLDSNGRVEQCDTQGEAAYGVLQNKPGALGRAATVARGGLCKIEADAALAIDALITTDAQGRADAAASGDIVRGRLVANPSGAAGDLVQVDLDDPLVGTTVA